MLRTLFRMSAALFAETRDGRFVRLKRGNRLDKACNRQRIAHAPGAANQMDRAPFARKLNGNPHQGGNPRAVNLRHVIQIDDHLAAAPVDHRTQSLIELFARLANRKPASDFQQMNAVGLADRNFHGDMFGHVRLASDETGRRNSPSAPGIIDEERRDHKGFGLMGTGSVSIFLIRDTRAQKFKPIHYRVMIWKYPENRELQLSRLARDPSLSRLPRVHQKIESSP